MFVSAALNRRDGAREECRGEEEEEEALYQETGAGCALQHWAQRRPAAIMHAGGFCGEISSVLGDKVRAR